MFKESLNVIVRYIFFNRSKKINGKSLYSLSSKGQKAREWKFSVKKKVQIPIKYSLKYIIVCKKFYCDLHIELEFAMYFKDYVMWIFKPVTTIRLRVLK